MDSTRPKGEEKGRPIVAFSGAGSVMSDDQPHTCYNDAT